MTTRIELESVPFSDGLLSRERTRERQTHTQDAVTTGGTVHHERDRHARRYERMAHHERCRRIGLANDNVFQQRACGHTHEMALKEVNGG